MRDFYERQDQAHEETFYLVGLLIAASALTVALVSTLMAAVISLMPLAHLRLTTKIEIPDDFLRDQFLFLIWPNLVIALSIVVGTMIYRMSQVSKTGGRGVAEELGGKRIRELDATSEHRKILNIVDELAIAAGIRSPGVFIIEEELTINGFAAGWNEKDAVVCVTRGAVQQLNREQLQGLVAHEFSHIIKNDIVLNTRLVGALAGLRALGRMAGWCLGIGRSKGVVSNGLGGFLLSCIGIVIYPVGKVGELLASLIVQAVTRQREFLADAHAVELTRSPYGLRETLELIAAEQQSKPISISGVEFASHMYFADIRGLKRRLFSTHPPISERILRLQDGAPAPPEATIGDDPVARTEALLQSAAADV